MLDSEGELIEEQSEVKMQADPEELVKRELVEHPEILEAATERKMRKFAPSGLIVLLVGVVLIALGLFIHSGEYTIGGFVAGVGVIVVIIGMCRLLIGLIKPIVPSQL
ncbi:MAG TPA: hypothetical protein VNW73_05535 [Ktedonobacteraceae bacterium]|jgi:hypothetical protein|nr:hypothetical protein [Ktedonobacteraceae bacterium]